MISACKKSETLNAPANIKGMQSVAEARQYFEQTVLPNSPATQGKKQMTAQQLAQDPETDDRLCRFSI